jgi:hypothetical protein
MKSIRIALFFLLPFALNLHAAGTPAPADAMAYIVSPAHGEVVGTRVKVVFGLTGMGVAPAGVDKPNTGHHHLLIDTGLPDLDKPIPADDQHRHFGGGQTEAVIELTPGKHTLQLLLADYAHTPHSPPVMSQQITVIVR